MFNLLDNAWKFNEQTSRSADRIRADGKYKPTPVLLVRDDGA